MTTLSWSTSAYEKIAGLVAARSGLSFSPSLRDQAEAGIRRSMSRLGISDPVQYCTLLESDGTPFDDLVCELTVGETYFFRDPAQFEFLRREILPEVLGRRGSDHVIRLLSAGCSTGEEAYTLAILLEEEGLAGQSRVRGIDVSRAALEKARKGIYGRWSLRATEEDFAARYFHEREERYSLDDRFRNAVSFEQVNLAQECYPSYASGFWGLDVIFCRNVLIYFDEKTIEGVVTRLLDSLAPGGWLVAGASDPPLTDYAPCQAILTKSGLFYRRSNTKSDLEAKPQPPEAMSLSSSSLAPEQHGREELDHEDFQRLGAATGPHEGDPLGEAVRMFSRGEYARVLELTGGLPGIPEAEALTVRAIANLRGSREAEDWIRDRIRRYPTIPELHYLHAVLLIDLRQEEGAIGCLKKVLYLDSSLVVANLTLGTLLRRKRDRAGARRALKGALEFLSAVREDEVVPLSQGEPAGDLARLARAELALLEGDR